MGVVVFEKPTLAWGGGLREAGQPVEGAMLDHIEADLGGFHLLALGAQRGLLQVHLSLEPSLLPSHRLVLGLPLLRAWMKQFFNLLREPGRGRGGRETQ